MTVDLNPLKENLQANREIYQKYFPDDYKSRFTDQQKHLLDYLDSYSAAYKNNQLSGYLGSRTGNQAMSFINADDFSLKYGNIWKSPETSKHFKNMQMKACYHNSLKLSEKSADKLIYVEGIVISQALPIPISHAWVVDKTGQVIETTIRADINPENSIYLGVPFKSEDVRRVFEMENQYGVVCKSAFKLNVLNGQFSLEDHMKNNFPSLTIQKQPALIEHTAMQHR